MTVSNDARDREIEGTVVIEAKDPDEMLRGGKLGEDPVESDLEPEDSDSEPEDPEPVEPRETVDPRDLDIPDDSEDCEASLIFWERAMQGRVLVLPRMMNARLALMVSTRFMLVPGASPILPPHL